MNPIDPKTLIDASTALKLPAPVWFIELFKWLGFTLHAVPMNLWYAGILVAMLLYAAGGDQGRRFAQRLMAQMPVIIAMGINFGIVPLLFVQVGFSQIFYPATILMAWFWLAIIGLLIPAYYGVYIYALGLSKDGPAMPGWKHATGWLAALLFLIIGFVFANAMSLMENVKAWPELWQAHSVDGAALGTALNIADMRFWPRWLLMFGLALTTTAAWIAFDAAWFARREKPEYRQWAKRFAWKLYAVGAVWFMAYGAWYSFFTWSAGTQDVMFRSLWVILTIATAIAPGVPLVLLWLASRSESDIGRGFASILGLSQFAVLGVNAASRQFVQHLELKSYYDITTQTPDVQWSPLLTFVITFAVGLLVAVWMIYQVARLPAVKPEGKAAR